MSSLQQGIAILVGWLLEQATTPPAEPRPHEPIEWFRHYLASTAYCSGNKRTFYALTFDSDGDDKSRELFNAIIEAISNRCGNETSTGYAVDTTEEGRDSGNTYPSIEVGEL